MKKVQLLTTHEHCGAVHVAGTVLEVSDADAVFLTTRQLARLLEDKQPDEPVKGKGKNKDKVAEITVEQTEENATDNPVGDETQPTDTTQGEQ